MLGGARRRVSAAASGSPNALCMLCRNEALVVQPTDFRRDAARLPARRTKDCAHARGFAKCVKPPRGPGEPQQNSKSKPHRGAPRARRRRRTPPHALNSCARTPAVALPKTRKTAPKNNPGRKWRASRASP